MSDIDFQGIKKQIDGLKKEKRFSQARRLLLPLVPGKEEDPKTHSSAVLIAKDRLWLCQQLSLCTYKDTELARDTGLTEALEILSRGDDLKSTTNHETLSIAGAIYKRKWELSADHLALLKSLRFYERARDSSRELDKEAYSQVNIALIKQIMFQADGGSGPCPESTVAWNAVIKKEGEILTKNKYEDTDEKVRENAWWARACLIEARFATGALDAFRILADRTLKEWKPHDWQLETLVRQLALLLDLGLFDKGAQEKAAQASAVFVGPAALSGLRLGKVGLALSGGGFRAALYHVGTLARLAEMDVLRHVEVISCVSGGSILGALYYLELRKELQVRTDDQMTRQVYIDVVRRVESKLSTALKRNIRTRAFLRAAYRFRSPTRMLGLLLSERLFDADHPGGGDHHAPTEPTAFHKLIIQPKDFVKTKEEEVFNPKLYNWKRSAKVPILIVNCTTLNTGHNWQFTATWMGEAPASIESAIDSGKRLRRMHYRQAPKPWRDLTLSDAVAASAAVPGIFRPIKLNGLYPDSKVLLSDGGVNDNQGIFGLAEQDCSVVLVSDGCGQLEMLPHPSGFPGAVGFRANNILMDTVRRDGYRILKERRASGQLKKLCFSHLKYGLSVKDVGWIGASDEKADVLAQSATSGIDSDVQHALARIRTDLDEFSTDERNALMCAGYLIAERTFTDLLKVSGASAKRFDGWGFLAVQDLMPPRRATTTFLNELRCGHYKIWRKWFRLKPKTA